MLKFPFSEATCIGAAVLGELTRYKATLQGAHRKIEFPLWGEDMPDETVALVTAKEAAKALPKFEQFCAQQKLAPGSAAAKTLWKHVQQFRREAGSFFTPAEHQSKQACLASTAGRGAEPTQPAWVDRTAKCNSRDQASDTDGTGNSSEPLAPVRGQLKKRNITYVKAFQESSD